MLPVKISENLREGMFDQACFGQYGQFQADILGDIETDMLFREVCRNGGESKFLLPIPGAATPFQANEDLYRMPGLLQIQKSMLFKHWTVVDYEKCSEFAISQCCSSSQEQEGKVC